MKKLLAAALLATTPALAHDGVLHDPNLPPKTKAQIHEVAAAVERYKDFRVAEREGWKKFGGDEPLMGEHWHHPQGPDYVSSDPDLEFARPSNLMYTEIGGRKMLTGVAFVVRLGPGERLPEGFAGRADSWHVHDFEAAIEAATEQRPILRWLANAWLDDNYRKHGDNRGRLAMAHAWVTLPNPDGVFADHNRTLPYLKLGLPASFADGAGLAAAKGLHLATKNGCADTIDGRLWIADAARKATRAIKATCATSAGQVRATLQGDARAINASAAQAWRQFDAAWIANLSPEQRARVAAMSEHGGHGEAQGHSEAQRHGNH